MIGPIITVDKKTKKCRDKYPENRLIQGGLGRDFMSLFMKQAQIKHQKDDDNDRKSTK